MFQMWDSWIVTFIAMGIRIPKQVLSLLEGGVSPMYLWGETSALTPDLVLNGALHTFKAGTNYSTDIIIQGLFQQGNLII